ncbi:MAG: 3-isopropylmalate dehydratase small subunit [Burkholderiales bacterium]|nr:3-isopropylmalate dehydratase small subunit [Burkholderiales bacterium]
MPSFDQLESTLHVLLVDNIDTDQIIPARFLKATDKAGMGEALFADWRFHPDGTPREDFPLNRPERQGAQALLAGDNFGCGSSREHAPWALTGFGLRAVISTSFADIFRNNALKNGLLPVEVDAQTHRALVEQSADPAARVLIDLRAQTLRLPDGRTATFPIAAFARTCLLNGVDELGYILGFSEQIEAYERRMAAG